MGTGVDLSETTDDQILPMIAVASAMANNYCSAPIGHDFRGGTVTDEKHHWDPGNVYRAGTTRVYPKHRPVKSVAGFRIDVTNTQYITISTNSLYINPAEGWVEPVALALTTAGMFGYALLPSIGLREPVARIAYDYGWQFEESNDLATVYSGSVLQLSNQFIDDSQEFALKKNGTELPSSSYDVDWNEGLVTVSGYDSTAVYSADYTHKLPWAIASATSLILSDLFGQQRIAGSGMLGLSGLKVEEIEIRQSAKVGLYSTPVNGAAARLLDPYVYLSWG